MAFSTDNIGKNCYINMSEDENVEDSLYGTIIGYYKDTDKNEEYYFVSINGNVKRIYDDSLVNIIEDGGGGGSVTPQGIVDATSQMTDEQAADTLDNIGAEPEKMVVTVTYDDQTDLYTADKTSAEIWAAYDSGKTVEAVNDGCVFRCVYADSGPSAGFVCVLLGNAGERILNLFVDDTDYWEFIEQTTDPIVIPVAGWTPTIEPQTNTIYKCGEITSLTISNPPDTVAYSIVFTSGATATTTTIPATILGLENFVAEANTIYEINVLDNRAVVGSWAVTP